MLLPLCNRCKPLHSGHIKILMNFINQTLCVKMKNKATLQFILTPCGFNFGGNKICFSLQRPPSYILQAGIFVGGEYIKHFLNPIGRCGPVILSHCPELCLSLDSGICRNNKPIDVMSEHAQELLQLFAKSQIEIFVHLIQITLCWHTLLLC